MKRKILSVVPSEVAIPILPKFVGIITRLSFLKKTLPCDELLSPKQLLMKIWLKSLFRFRSFSCKFYKVNSKLLTLTASSIFMARNLFNSFEATGLFLYSLKISENQRFSDVFRGYRKRPVAWNGQTDLYFCEVCCL